MGAPWGHKGTTRGLLCLVSEEGAVSAAQLPEAVGFMPGLSFLRRHRCPSRAVLCLEVSCRGHRDEHFCSLSVACSRHRLKPRRRRSKGHGRCG